MVSTSDLFHLQPYYPMFRQFIILICIAPLAPTSTLQDKKQSEKKELPKVLYSVPLVVKTDAKQKLIIRGKGLATVKEFKVVGIDGAKVTSSGGKMVTVPNNFPAGRYGDSEVELELHLPKEAKPGDVKLVAIGPGGESNPYILLLRDELPAVLENEPNDGFDQAQEIPVPSAVEGTIKGEKDVDVFKFEGKKGDKLRIEIQAARFGSPLDAGLTLYDSGRRIIDSAGDRSDNPDPFLDVSLPKDGVYYLSVIDANDLGGPNFGYRLLVRSRK
jgi:hypothetical protein